MSKRTFLQLLLILLVTASVICLSTPAAARSGGISGYSGRTGANCMNCHSDYGILAATITGPTSVPSGSTNTYTLSFAGGDPAAAGLDVSVTGGTLAAGAGTRILNLEVTHASPSSTPSWTYTWTAPTVTANTTVTMYGATVDNYGGSTGTAVLPITVTAPVALPNLNVSPASLSFSYEIGGANPAAQNLSVTSSGAALNYTTSDSSTWLAVTPASGSTPGTVAVSVNPAGLAAGTYSGTVTIASTGAANTPRTIPVTLTVTAPALPNMSVTPASLAFSYQIGNAAPAAQNVSVSSSGAAFTYTTSSSAAWLTASPASGSTPGTVAVSVNPSGLAAGSYSGTVTIASTGAANSPRTVPVTLTVTAAPLPNMSVAPTSLAFSYQIGGANPAAQNVSVSSSGAAINYTVSKSAAWLTTSPASGSTPGTVAVSVNPAGLAAGSYSGTVTIASTGAANSPRTVPVTLTVTAAALPNLSVTPASLSFSYQIGNAAPAAQNVSVSSSGAALNYTITKSAAWLSASPTSGSTPGTVAVSVNPGGLAAGTYTGTVTVASTGAANTPRTVGVTLTVTAAPVAPNLQVSPSSLSFAYTVGGANPAAQNVSVSSSGSALNYTASTSAAWLSVGPASGSTPGTVAVSVNPSGLAAGTYTGTVSIAAAGAGNSPRTVAVTLVVTQPAAATLSVSPTQLSFSYQTGGAAPAPKAVAVSSSGAPLNFTVSDSAAWLSATPGSGTTPATVNVAVNPAGLAVGTYTGSVTIASSGGSRTVAVSLTVTSSTATGEIRLRPKRLVFYAGDGAAPGPQRFSVTSDGAALTFTAATFGGSWFSVTPSGGTTPAELTVSVYPAGMPTGTYSGLVKVTAGTSSRKVEIVLVVATHEADDDEHESSRFVPFTFDPNAAGEVSAGWVDGAADAGTAATQGLVLAKSTSARPTALAGVAIKRSNVPQLTEVGFDLLDGSQCTSEGPQFVVVTADNVTHVAGCASGSARSIVPGWKRVRFTPAQFAPAVQAGTAVKTIAVVLDKPAGNGIAVLNNFNVNGLFTRNE
ncbi:MAG: beta strand repeat-containing protein [Terriglobales bacterium]